MTSALPRPGLREVAPYASPQLDVAARLNTNECPSSLPKAYFDDLAQVVRELPLHRYPDAQAEGLRHEIARCAGHALGADGTWVANGSNEILTQLLEAYGGPGRRAITFEPTYLLHARLCWLTQTDLVRLRLPEDFALTDRQVTEAIGARPDVVFVCSPNNPTGNAQAVAVVEEIAMRLPATLIVVDEAYIEFGGESALRCVPSRPNLVVVRTFSKAFALAGARVGYALASPDVVGDLQRVRLPYHLSSLTQAAGMIALRHREEALALLSEIRVQRDRIVDGLTSLEALSVYPSDANFVLFVPRRDAKTVWQALLDRDVLVRDMTAVVPNALRVTAGAAHEVDLFLKVLPEVL
jgi:histidinol-phosphate aminotransferase